MLADVEFRSARQLTALIEANPRANIIERIADRQCGGCQHAGGHALEQSFAEYSGDIDRTGLQKNSAVTPLDPRNIVFQIAAAKNLELAFKLAGAPRQCLVLAGKIFHLFDRMAGFLERSNQRIDAVQTGDGLPTLAKQRETAEESFRGPRDNINIGLQLSCIVDEFRQPIVADVKAKVFGRNILELVRFVEDYSAVIRQYCGNIRLANHEIGEKKMIIHDINVGLHRLLPRECEEASVVILALCAQTSLAPRIHARP